MPQATHVPAQPEPVHSAETRVWQESASKLSNSHVAAITTALPHQSTAAPDLLEWLCGDRVDLCTFIHYVHSSGRLKAGKGATMHAPAGTSSCAQRRPTTPNRGN